MSADNWQPSASMDTLKKRAALLRLIRCYFDQQGVMEVETPMLSVAATVDAYIDSFQCNYNPVGAGAGQRCYLHTSPEFAMKRLLAAGSGDIYALERVFRNGEAGGRHNPEFTLLEWYRVGQDLSALMDDVNDLLTAVSPFVQVRRCSYQELFEQQLGINPHTASVDELRALVSERVDGQLSGLDSADCLDLLFSSLIEPTLGHRQASSLEGVFVYDYPVALSALARLRQNDSGHQVAARFELYVNGMELANGYHELLDAQEQQERFQAQQRKRQAQGLPVYPFDRNLLAALSHGLPDCSGVALGVDRLLMLMLKSQQIADVIAFDFSRA